MQTNTKNVKQKEPFNISAGYKFIKQVQVAYRNSVIEFRETI